MGRPLNSRMENLSPFSKRIIRFRVRSDPKLAAFFKVVLCSEVVLRSEEHPTAIRQIRHKKMVFCAFIFALLIVLNR